jgi:hypothetical protein
MVQMVSNPTKAALANLLLAPAYAPLVMSIMLSGDPRIQDDPLRYAAVMTIAYAGPLAPLSPIVASAVTAYTQDIRFLSISALPIMVIGGGFGALQLIDRMERHNDPVVLDPVVLDK